MRVAWSCNPWPAVIVFVAAATAEDAARLADSRIGGRALRPAMRWPAMDAAAAACASDAVLRMEEY